MAIIRLFASLREKIGVSEFEARISGRIPLRQALTAAANSRQIDPRLLTSGPILYAVNQKMASLDSMVEQMDEIALLPPMSGG